jgi:hypothetical protein
MNKIDIRAIPELKTRIGIHGSTKQQEVGGPVCVAIIVAIITSSELSEP